MLLENDAPTRLLLLMTQAGIVEMVAVGVVVVATPVVLFLMRALWCVGGVARPVTGSYMAHRHENGTAFRTGEESMSFVGPVAGTPACR